MFKENVVDCQVLEDDTLTPYEEEQMEYEGFIQYYPLEIDIDSNIMTKKIVPSKGIETELKFKLLGKGEFEKMKEV